jgi:hypothetical protein
VGNLLIFVAYRQQVLQKRRLLRHSRARESEREERGKREGSEREVRERDIHSRRAFRNLARIVAIQKSHNSVVACAFV